MQQHELSPGISLIRVLCTFPEEEKDALVQKHHKEINSESGVGWRFVWSISPCPSARARLCQGIAVSLVLLPWHVGRGGVTWGLGMRIGMGKGREDTAGRVWGCHCAQLWFAPIREICKAERNLAWC